MKKWIGVICVVLCTTVMILSCGKKSEQNLNTNASNEKVNNEELVGNKDEENLEMDKKDELIENKDELLTKIGSLWNEVFEVIYSYDYSNDNNDKINAFIDENFTIEGAEKIRTKINSYSNKINFENLQITNIKEVKNIGGVDHKATYEVEYNVTIINGKPFAYNGIIGTVVLKNDRKLIVDTVGNENNF